MTTILVGAVAFATTNLDDILLLAVFFAQPGRRSAAIVLGQYLGIGALVGVSVLAAGAAVVVPSDWIPALGLVPVALGIKYLLTSGLVAAPNATATSALAIASITAANGGDNLGVYIPMFAARPDAIAIYVVVFAVGTAVWCAAGHWLATHGTVGAVLRKYGRALLPWVLIAIGVHVMSAWWTSS